MSRRNSSADTTETPREFLQDANCVCIMGLIHVTVQLYQYHAVKKRLMSMYFEPFYTLSIAKLLHFPSFVKCLFPQNGNIFSWFYGWIKQSNFLGKPCSNNSSGTTLQSFGKCLQHSNQAQFSFHKFSGFSFSEYILNIIHFRGYTVCNIVTRPSSLATNLVYFLSQNIYLT